MYFSNVVAIAVLTFTASALAAPTTTDFDIAAPIEAREAEADGTSFDVAVRDADVDVDVDSPWGTADEDEPEILEAREAGLHLEARGFGCGVLSSRYECNEHVSGLVALHCSETEVANIFLKCKSLGGGRTGGYCGGFLYHTCKCIFG
jgi:hypothetical protein